MQREPDGGRQFAGPVDSLDPAVGAVGEEQEAFVGVEAERATRLVAGQRSEPIEREADRQRLHPPVERARQQRDEIVRGEPDQPLGRQHRERHEPRLAVPEVATVQGHRAAAGADGEGRHGGQAEVGVDDVVAPAAVPFAESAGGGPVPAGGELVELDLDPGDPPQRRHLVADEAAAFRVLGVGRHVRHDEDTHLVLIVHG